MNGSKGDPKDERNDEPRNEGEKKRNESIPCHAAEKLPSGREHVASKIGGVRMTEKREIVNA